MRDLLVAHPELEAQETVNVRREGLRTQRSAVDDLLRLGLISEDIHSELVNEIDREIESENPQLLGVQPRPEEVAA